MFCFVASENYHKETEVVFASTCLFLLHLAHERSNDHTLANPRWVETGTTYLYSPTRVLSFAFVFNSRPFFNGYDNKCIFDIVILMRTESIILHLC